MTSPTAIYHVEKGVIMWRGSGERFSYRSLDEAVRLRDNFARQTKNDGVPGWVETCQGFAADLTKAIEDYEADNVIHA